MAISREEVLHVASLAHLELTEEEVERFTEQLGAILGAVGKVAELDLTDVEPLSHPLDPVDEALANAPESEDNHFRVPPTGMTRES